MEWDELIRIWIIVCPLVFLGGLIDAVAGGGGLITLPAYLLAGLPPHLASGTNKCGNFFGTLIATGRFLKRGDVHLPSALAGGAGALVGAWLGARLNMIMPEQALYYLMLAVVPVMAVFLLFKRDFGTEDRSGELGVGKLVPLSLAIGLVIGCYDGFFGPGAGTFLTLAFTGLCRFDLLTAAGNTKVANATSNLASLVTFALGGKVLWAVGIPAALQMAVTAFSNVFVQGYINYFDTDCMSGWTAYTKVDQLVILPVQSISMAGTTFVGQNLGVGDTPRAKKGVRMALYLSFAVTAVLLVPVLLLAPELTAFFNQKPEVVSYGALLLRLLSPFYFFFCINQVYSAALRGAGNSQVPMWIMLGSFVVFRQIYLFVVANYVANEIIPIALSYPAGWFLCSAATLIYYSRCRFDKHRLVEDV